MTKYDIIRMAREAGIAGIAWMEGLNGAGYGINKVSDMKKFATLVAQAEREAYAKVCDDIDTEYNGEDVQATWCAKAIRARGQQ